jgi:hypothetical protein
LTNVSQNKTTNNFFTTESMFEECCIKWNYQYTLWFKPMFEECYLENKISDAYFSAKFTCLRMFRKIRLQMLTLLQDLFSKHLTQNGTANTYFNSKYVFGECFTKWDYQ